MQTQQMAHAQITLPPDCLALVTALVTKLGGQVVSDASACLVCNPMPALDRGGKTLQGLRQRAGLTQKAVAESLGIPQSHISEFETNKRSIPFKHAQKLAALFHTPPSHFMRPNAESLEAMDALGKGNGRQSASAEELFEDLGI